MRDYLNSVLDELVPTFADEGGDWGRVVSDAGAETPTTTAQRWPVDTAASSAAPRRRRGRWAARWLTRPRLVAIAVTALLAALLVTPALGIGDHLLSLIQRKPSPFEDFRPAWSPDGRSIAFVSTRDQQSEIHVMNPDGSGKRDLTRDGANDDYPTWSPDGRRIAFLRAPRSNRVRDLSGYQLYVVNADGSGLRRLPLSPTGPYRYPLRYPPVWSPDGRTIYSGRYLVSADGSGSRWLPYIPLTAVWSPDGRRIAFARPRGRTGPGPCCYASHSDIYVMNADGSGTRKLTHNAHQNAEPAWSPDGRKIAFRSTRDGNRDIYVMNADGSGKRNLTRNAAWDSRPSWSPDGRKITFVSNRDGRLEAHVMNADGSGQRSLTLQGS